MIKRKKLVDKGRKGAEGSMRYNSVISFVVGLMHLLSVRVGGEGLVAAAGYSSWSCADLHPGLVNCAEAGEGACCIEENDLTARAQMNFRPGAQGKSRRRELGSYNVINAARVQFTADFLYNDLDGLMTVRNPSQPRSLSALLKLYVRLRADGKALLGHWNEYSWAPPFTDDTLRQTGFQGADPAAGLHRHHGRRRDEAIEAELLGLAGALCEGDAGACGDQQLSGTAAFARCLGRSGGSVGGDSGTGGGGGDDGSSCLDRMRRLAAALRFVHEEYYRKLHTCCDVGDVAATDENGDYSMFGFASSSQAVHGGQLALGCVADGGYQPTATCDCASGSWQVPAADAALCGPGHSGDAGGGGCDRERPCVDTAWEDDYGGYASTGFLAPCGGLRSGEACEVPCLYDAGISFWAYCTCWDRNFQGADSACSAPAGRTLAISSSQSSDDPVSTPAPTPPASADGSTETGDSSDGGRSANFIALGLTVGGILIACAATAVAVTLKKRRRKAAMKTQPASFPGAAGDGTDRDSPLPPCSYSYVVPRSGLSNGASGISDVSISWGHNGPEQDSKRETEDFS
ncbi:unnamed protein product [Phaeothamnion confervicola]